MVRNWVQQILKTMLKFVFPQVTQDELQSLDKFHCFRNMIVKNTIRRWCHKSKDTVCKYIETA